MAITRFTSGIAPTCPLKRTGSIWDPSITAMMLYVKQRSITRRSMGAIGVLKNATRDEARIS